MNRKRFIDRLEYFFPELYTRVLVNPHPPEILLLDNHKDYDEEDEEDFNICTSSSRESYCDIHQLMVITKFRDSDFYKNSEFYKTLVYNNTRSAGNPPIPCNGMEEYTLFFTYLSDNKHKHDFWLL